MDLEEFTLVDVEVVRFLSECEDRGIVIGSLPTLCSRVDSSRAGFERSLLSNSLSACLGQPTSKGESIGSRSVLDSTLVPVLGFRHLASARHHAERQTPDPPRSQYDYRASTSVTTRV
jgi:hypothetical protein